jgi:hypothetical protein
MPLDEDIVVKTMTYIKDRRTAVIAEHDTLRDVALKSKALEDTSGDKLAGDLKRRINDNINILTNFFYNTDYPQISTTISINPIVEINKLSLKLLGDDEDAACRFIYNKATPRGYDNTDIATLGSGDYWCSTYSSAYSNILIMLAKNAKDKIDLNLDSSIFHVTPLATDLATNLSGYEYLYKDSGFGFVHNGWVYDGSRHDSALYPTRKKFAPIDCTVFVGNMLGLNNQFRTRDMLFSLRNKQKLGYMPDSWDTTDLANELATKFDEVHREDVQSGDIYLRFDFEKSDKATNLRANVSGHSTIVYSVQDGEVLTLGAGQTTYARDGFGFETFSMHPSVINEDGSISETKFVRLKQ